LWIDKKKQMDTSGGVLRGPKRGPRPRLEPPEPTYSVAQVAEIFDVTKQTVYKWLQVEDDDSVIPKDG